MCQLLEAGESGGVAVLNNRQRMYATNKLVKQWLLENGYDQIWFKRHTKDKDLVFTQKGNYLATDLWNLFDGVCFNRYGFPVYLQMKTNAWASEKEINSFLDSHNISVLVLNVTNKLKECKGKYRLFHRYYHSTSFGEVPKNGL